MSLALNRLLIALLGIAILGMTSVRADVLELQPDHPDRYTVVDGDTLWSISSRFLKSPWNWPKIWKINQQVENPHLIYPGDVILMRWVDGQPELSVLRPEKMQPEVAPQVPGEAPIQKISPRRRPVGDRERLSPQVRSLAREQAIPTIPPEAIAPFLTRSMIVSGKELKESGYVTIGTNDHRALGGDEEFYARGIKDTSHEYYYIFRIGRVLKDPKSRRLLGYEAIYLADATMVQPGRNRTGTSKLKITNVAQEILPTDRLLPVLEAPPLPVYHPKAPKGDVRGSIILAHKGLTEVGQWGVVVVNLGEKDGMEAGHVLQVWHRAGKHLDPVSKRYYMRPEERSGLLMVFSTFKRVSYGLVLESNQPIRVMDSVSTP